MVLPRILSKLFYRNCRICSNSAFSIMSRPAKRKSTATDSLASDIGSSGKQQKLSNFFTRVDVETSTKKTEVKVTVGDNNVVVSTNEQSKTEVVVQTENNGLSALLLEKSWKSLLRAEFNKPYFKDIEKFLQTAAGAKKVIYPPKELIFNAFNLTPVHELKVVIIGQDPYHGVGQAHGLSFSVPKNIEPPPSLKNIFIELSKDISGFQKPNHGCLEAWAKRGVLLLNATLTVEAHKANSHASIGWQQFTDAVIKQVANECENLIFLLWGGFAQRKAALINGASKRGHTIIKTAHPSPLSVTKFFGCRCFSKANEALKKSGKGEIEWSLIDG